MEKYKRYYGLALFLTVVLVVIYSSYNLVVPKINELKSLNAKIEKTNKTYEAKRKEKQIVENKIKKLRDSLSSTQKKIYSPIESDLGNDTLFFTLYSDVIEMIHSNSIKIKSINYTYNPQSDEFVKYGKDEYFVCDIDMNLVSNYINLGKLIQDIYQYPYYIKINNLEVMPYPADKKILLTTLTLRLYAHTEPVSEQETVIPIIQDESIAKP